VPIFWFALILKYWFAFKYGDITNLPLGYRFDAILWELDDPIERPTGLLLVDSLLAGSWVHFKDAFMHLILPATTLGYASMATTIRLMRGNMLDVLEQDYVRTAKAKGLSSTKVILGHASKNAMIPTVTLLGMGFAGLLSGSVLTETIFQWPGLGLWTIQAMRNLDVSAILGLVIFSAILTILANLLVDIAYAYLDPRVDLGSQISITEIVIVLLSFVLLGAAYSDLSLGLVMLSVIVFLTAAGIAFAAAYFLSTVREISDLWAPALLFGTAIVVMSIFKSPESSSELANYFRFIPDFSQLVLILLAIWILSIAIFITFSLCFEVFIFLQININPTIKKLHSKIEPWSEFVSSLGPRRKEWKRMSYQFFRNPLAVFGLVMVTLLLLMALFAPVLAPPTEAQLERDPMRMEENFEFNHNLQPPCIEWWSLHPLEGCTGERGEENGFILGSTNKGYDIYYGIIWGSRTSLDVAVKVVFTGTFIAVVIGVISGYYGGRVDEVVMRITDVFLAIPGLVLALAIIAVTNDSSIENLMYALIIVSWPGFTRIIRAEALRIRKLPYVEAARAAGASDFRLIFVHVLPNCITSIIVIATMDMGGIVLSLAGLGFLGFGGGPDLAEWGKLVSFGQGHLLAGETWAFFYPGLVIALWALGFYLLGDGLRDILDPRQRD
jgi:peptide/nickel transport system permease protein